MIHCLPIFINSCVTNPRSALKSAPFLDIKIALKVKTTQIETMSKIRSGCFEQQNLSDEIVFSRNWVRWHWNPMFPIKSGKKNICSRGEILAYKFYGWRSRELKQFAISHHSQWTWNPGSTTYSIAFIYVFQTLVIELLQDYLSRKPISVLCWKFPSSFWKS